MPRALVRTAPFLLSRPVFPCWERVVSRINPSGKYASRPFTLGLASDRTDGAKQSAPKICTHNLRKGAIDGESQESKATPHLARSPVMLTKAAPKDLIHQDSLRLTNPQLRALVVQPRLTTLRIA